MASAFLQKNRARFSNIQRSRSLRERWPIQRRAYLRKLTHTAYLEPPSRWSQESWASFATARHHNVSGHNCLAEALKNGDIQDHPFGFPKPCRFGLEVPMWYTGYLGSAMHANLRNLALELLIIRINWERKLSSTFTEKKGLTIRKHNNAA